VLDRLLPLLPKNNHPNLLVGPSTLDDAGVFRLSDSLALVQTVDFFTPIVDDAYEYGRIAAANSLSDVYAMGGTPITALNIVGFPDGDLPEEVLADILKGAAAVCAEAGVAVAGGHSVSDKELKFGLAVTGTVHPDRILANSGARPGQALLLTKPLGTGVISNAMMNDAAPEGSVEAMIEVMARLNRAASEVALKHHASAATDVTGFGLLGHARELAVASQATLHLDASALPLLPGALEVASSGSYYSGGERRNLKHCARDAEIDATVPDPLQRLLADPQTSGGLLIALDEDQVSNFLRAFDARGEQAWRIGWVTDYDGKRIRVHSDETE